MLRGRITAWEPSVEGNVWLLELELVRHYFMPGALGALGAPGAPGAAGIPGAPGAAGAPGAPAGIGLLKLAISAAVNSWLHSGHAVMPA